MLLLSAFLCSQWCSAAEAEKNKLLKPEPGFEVDAGIVNGEINGIALDEVLKEFQVYLRLEYTIPPDLAPYPVTTRLENLVLEKALKRILTPFNYSFFKGNDADQYILIVYGVNDALRPTLSTTEGDQAVPGTTAGVATVDSEAERRRAVEKEIDFEVANQNLGPPEELHHLFYPEQNQTAE